MLCTQCNQEQPSETLIGVCTQCAPTTLPGIIHSVSVASFWSDNLPKEKASIAESVQQAVEQSAF